MLFLSKLFKILGHVWIGGAILVYIVSIIGILLGASTFLSGMRRVLDLFNPFNITNFVMTVLLFLPALGLYKAAAIFEAKVARRPPHPSRPVITHDAVVRTIKQIYATRPTTQNSSKKNPE